MSATTYEPMKPDVKRLWVAELRSGRHTQGFGRLRSADGSLCCLGVLQTLAIEAGVDTEPYWDGSDSGPDVLTDLATAEWSGVGEKAQTTLWSMNDGGYECPGKREHATFPEIADWVEVNL